MAIGRENKTCQQKELHQKANRLAYLLYPSLNDKERAEKLKEIHYKAKLRNNVSSRKRIGYKGWEKIYSWLCDRIADAQQLKGTEDL